MLKRLTTRGIFYDTECINLYLERLNETRKYKQYIAEEANFFLSSNKEQFQVVLDRARNADNDYDGILQKRFVTTDGSSYLFSQYDNNGKPIISLLEGIPPQTMHRFKPASLYSKENKKVLIPDGIFLNNLTLSRLVATSVPIAITLLALVVTGLIASLIASSQEFKLTVYIISALLLPASLMLVILHFSWKNRLKKKYYNGTNPFTFK